MSQKIESIIISKDNIKILDQTLLPQQEKYLDMNSYEDMIEAIKKLRIRGAPALGVAAATAGYLAAKRYSLDKDAKQSILKAISEIEASRPTAVNLFMATQELRKLINEEFSDTIVDVFYSYLEKLFAYEVQAGKMMGKLGCKEIGKQNLNILTHCNTGSLATVGLGTALAVIRTLADNYNIHVYVDETRPLLQGARLTMWELGKSGIPCTLITDNMAAATIREKRINCIITGADRIAANGDSANKIGTFNLAVLAKYFEIPMYIVAPESTIDNNISDGSMINIEERSPEEVAGFRSERTAPKGCNVFNPAFDVTPSELITAIITDKSVYHYPFAFC